MLKQRLLNSMNGFGDDMMRMSGVGEFASSWPLFGQPAPTNYTTALQLVAKQGWPFQQHSLSPAEDKLTIDTFEAVNKTTPIAPLHWSIAHAARIDPPTIARFKAIGAGVAVHPFAYLAGGPGAGPPLRTLVDSGIHVGAGSDSAQISTLDPWLLMYYMVTGKNSSGVLINEGQQLTRMEALKLYTSENGWFLREEDRLGTIEPGTTIRLLNTPPATSVTTNLPASTCRSDSFTNASSWPSDPAFFSSCAAAANAAPSTRPAASNQILIISIIPRRALKPVTSPNHF